MLLWNEIADPANAYALFHLTTERGVPSHAPAPSMMSDDSRLGVCPNCGHDIRPIDELITYERSDSTIGVFAECPACGEVIDPE